jgi:hypothetical protein
LNKTPIFIAENWQNSQKIVIITSTPGLTQKLGPTFNRNVACLFFGRKCVWQLFSQSHPVTLAAVTPSPLFAEMQARKLRLWHLLRPTRIFAAPQISRKTGSLSDNRYDKKMKH